MNKREGTIKHNCWRRAFTALPALFAALGMVAVLGSLTGCSDEDASSVEITVVCTDEMREYFVDDSITDVEGFLQAAADEFAASYADLDVTITVTSSSDLSSITEDASEDGTATTANILFGSYTDLTSVVYSGLALPLDDIISVDMTSNIPANLLAAGVAPANDNTYLLPFSVSQKVLVINGDLFAACGLSDYAVQLASESAESGATTEDATEAALATATVQTWTADEWSSVLSTLVETLPSVASDECYALLLPGSGAEGAELAAALLSATGTTLSNDSGYLDLESDEYIGAVEWLCSLIEQGVFTGTTESLTAAEIGELFLDGKVAMTIIDVADIPQLYADLLTTDSESGGYVVSMDLAFVTLPYVGSQYGSEGESEGEGEGTAAETSELSCVIPVEAYGFAVLDTGDDTAAAIAKEFISYIYDSIKWKTYAAATGYAPADATIYDAYADQLLFGDELLDYADSMMNVFNLLPLNDEARAAFNTAIAWAVTEDKTTVETAASLNKAVNAYIEDVYHSSTLHE